jgi:hypothetical protein
MWLFLSRRIRMIVLTFLVGLAAPRVALLLRSYGAKRQGRPRQVALGAASVLEKAGAWARPPKRR